MSDMLCNFLQDPSKKAKHDKKKEDKTTKSSADSAGGQKNVAPPSKSEQKYIATV